MRKKLTTYALVGALGLTGVAGAALVAPTVAYAATGDSTALERRVTALKDALAGLVSDGTLTQQQADRVASTLAESPHAGGHHGRGGGRGAHLEALTALGITVDELRAAAGAGQTLAQLAEAQGVSQDEVVKALVAAGEEHLAEAVADGRLTQAEADERAADLEAQVTQRLDQPVRVKGDGHHGRHGGPAAEDQESSSTASPTPTA